MQNDIINISPSIHEFLLTHGYTENFTVTPIAGAGSGRRYFRIASDERKSVLQVSAEVNEDFKHFVEYSKTFREYGLPVPRVYCVDENACQVLQEDLGKRSLLDEAFPNDSKVLSGSARILYPEVIDALIQWQNASHQLFSHHTEIWLRRFDFAALKWESDYFTENYRELPEAPQGHYGNSGIGSQFLFARGGLRRSTDEGLDASRFPEPEHYDPPEFRSRICRFPGRSSWFHVL